MERNEKNTKGITLVVLVITIIVLLILAGVTINYTVGENGIITKTKKAGIMTEFASYIEEKGIFDVNRKLENMEYNEESLNAGKENLIYDTQGENKEGNIQTVIPSMKEKYLDKFQIIKGELLINTSESEEIEVAKELGIQVNPYEIIDGVLTSSNANLGLQTENGVVTIPDNVVEIGEGAFSGVTGLKEVIIPGSVKKIGANAFSYNTEIEKVIIENGVEIIGNAAFKNCSNLKEIIMPDSVKELKSEVFRYCTNLSKVKLSNNIEIIPNFLFNRCDILEIIELPNDLKQISTNAFSDCKKLDNVNIPAGVTSIASDAFLGCTNMNHLTIDKANEVYEIEEGIIYNKQNNSIMLLAPMATEETVTIREGVKLLETGALSICSSMKTLNLPSTLEEISGNSFGGIRSLETITIPTSNKKYKVEEGYLYSADGKELIYVVPTKQEVIISSKVEVIKSEAIKNDNITELIIPDNVTTIENESMSNTKKLQNIKIGKGVENLDTCFKVWGTYQNNLEIIIDEENQAYKVDENLIVTKDGKEVITFIKNSIETQTIPEGIETIKEEAFTGFAASAIFLPNSLKTIEQYGFFYCSSLTHIVIPNSVESIAGNAFSSCSKLEKIKIDKEAGSIKGAPWGAPKGDKVVEWLG